MICAKQVRRLLLIAKRAAIACFLLACLSTASAASSEPIVTVPYYFTDDGAMAVAVTIDGRGPYDFIIDTGATLTLAFENLAMRESFVATGAPPRRVIGITGSASRNTYRFGDIAIGPAVMRQHVGVILDDWSPPRKTPHGILGIDFFRQYAVVFDVRARTMSFYSHGGLPKKKIGGWRTIRLKQHTYATASGALYTALGFVNRSPTTFIIDLGSLTTLLNYDAAEAIFSGTVSFGSGTSLISGSRLKDVFDDRTQTRWGAIDRIQVGPVTWRRTVVWLKDAQIFEELGVADRPYGLLGADLIATQDFALDFGENRLYISKVNRKRR